MTHRAANDFDREIAGRYEARAADWRNGAVIYQVIVDRFVPSADLEAKRRLYPAPKTLRTWDEVPQRGTYLEAEQVWSHEIDFWGGDLASTRSRLDYVRELGADALYLTPIHDAYTNHGYDALDHGSIAPALGDRDDLRALADAVHALGMRLVLDGVFNHAGKNSERFRSASEDPSSPWRDWFVFGSEYAYGARRWMLVENLPEFNLENPEVRAYLYGAHDSVVRKFLRDGVDGWRLDTAFELGTEYLGELTAAAHAEKSDSLVVGEVPQYPKEWFPALDAVMHFTIRELLLGLLLGRIPALTAARMLQRIYSESSYEHLLRSWIILDNHDTPRLADALGDDALVRVARVLQCTLPGAPNLYYGGEVGMRGGDDPEMRAPMRWDLVEAGHPELTFTRQLLGMRRDHRALRVGDFREITCTQLLGFERYTDRVDETVLVLVNATDAEVAETVLVGNAKLIHGARFRDLLTGEVTGKVLWAGLLNVTIPARGVLVLSPETEAEGGYTGYKRVQ